MNERTPEADKTIPFSSDVPPTPKRKPTEKSEADLDPILEGVEANEAAIIKQVREKLEDIYPKAIRKVTISKVRQNDEGVIVWAQGTVHFNGPRGVEEREDFELNI